MFSWKIASLILQDAIKQAGVSFKKNPDALYKVVHKMVLPDIAINSIAGTVIGRKWRTATTAEKNAFIDEFGKVLVRAYASSLLKVSDYEIKFRPVRGTTWQKSQHFSIFAKIVNKETGDSSNATFYLQRSGNSWKIYDLAVEGVSIVKNFRAQFQSFDNMDALLSRLNAVNKAAEK